MPDDGCNWHEADSLNTLGLIESRLSVGGYSWHEANNLDAFGLIAG